MVIQAEYPNLDLVLCGFWSPETTASKFSKSSLVYRTGQGHLCHLGGVPWTGQHGTQSWLLPFWAFSDRPLLPHSWSLPRAPRSPGTLVDPSPRRAPGDRMAPTDGCSVCASESGEIGLPRIVLTL